MNMILTRRHFLRAGSFLGLAGFFALESCERIFEPSPIQPQLTFQELESGCASSEETAQLQGASGQIKLSGMMHTPTPCYHLQADLVTLRCGSSRCVNTYQIAITAKAQDGACIECVGSIHYRGEIRGLAPGDYTIGVTHDGRRIASELVHVS
ncbi:MAG: hypothetical protein A2Z21_01075 [Candidatus Fraserbacteria bacterium RBG_16_55_9]|uniref:Uncharacterized protein n=1 Tax=Fraserbacteria sp. (strain RBG_16_55_9) TaxID=1817864 RepID=A0A1F5USB6_FRAXR|nr:MAG: hypothetical protein A2Z21_01075 [Candidatus Fraserbacteria bacterium RBG_16_55_9]